MRLQRQFGAHRTCQGPQAPVSTLILTFRRRGTWGNSLVGLCFLWWPVAVVGGIWVEKGVMTEKKICQVSSWSASPPQGVCGSPKGQLGCGRPREGGLCAGSQSLCPERASCPAQTDTHKHARQGELLPQRGPGGHRLPLPMPPCGAAPTLTRPPGPICSLLSHPRRC